MQDSPHMWKEEPTHVGGVTYIPKVNYGSQVTSWDANQLSNPNMFSSRYLLNNESVKLAHKHNYQHTCCKKKKNMLAIRLLLFVSPFAFLI